MKYTTISLFDLLNLEYEIGKSTIVKILSDFSCPINPDVEHFMHHKAYDFEKTGLARTYLVYAHPSPDESYLVGIYSLGLSSVEISDNLTRSDKKKIFGTTYAIGKNIKTLLIGQLSKNYANGYNQYIKGYTLLTLAFSKIKQIHMLFPSVVVHIDCKDEIKLRQFYESNGFKLLKKQANDMLLYLQPTKKVVESVPIRMQQEEKEPA